MRGHDFRDEKINERSSPLQYRAVYRLMYGKLKLYPVSRFRDAVYFNKQSAAQVNRNRDFLRIGHFTISFKLN